MSDVCYVTKIAYARARTHTHTHTHTHTQRRGNTHLLPYLLKQYSRVLLEELVKK
jgi:hypothetical protein